MSGAEGQRKMMAGVAMLGTKTIDWQADSWTQQPVYVMIEEERLAKNG